MSTHSLCFEQKYEKYQNILSENFPFLVVKFSIHLNRCVFIMTDFISGDSTNEEDCIHLVDFPPFCTKGDNFNLQCAFLHT